MTQVTAAATLQHTAVDEFLPTLDLNTLSCVYKSPAACLALFRLLPPLAQHILTAHLFIPSASMRRGILVRQWAQPNGGAGREMSEAVATLLRLNILTPKPATAVIRDETPLALNPEYTRVLRLVLTNQSVPMYPFAMPVKGSIMSAAELERHFSEAQTRWDAILIYLASSAHHSSENSTDSDEDEDMERSYASDIVKLPQSVRAILFHANLLTSTSSITHHGFRFLLLPRFRQLWSLLLQFLDMSRQHTQMSVVEMLQFYFTLGSLELGNAYSVSVLTPTQRAMLGDLAALGVILHTQKSDVFYPTVLAISLTSTSSSASTADSQDTAGYVIIETNYRLYAYTTSIFQIAILRLFTELTTRLPNVVMGVISRESTRRAFSAGITAEQIIAFLEAHAHPQMRRAGAALGQQGSTSATSTGRAIPMTVVDQIKLWELERSRIRDNPAVLYTHFTDRGHFDRVLARAKETGVLRWASSPPSLEASGLSASMMPATGLMMAVTEHGHDDIKAFLSQR